MLSEISTTEKDKNSLNSLRCKIFKKKKKKKGKQNSNTENRWVIVRDGEWMVGKMDERGQKI